MTRAQSLLRVAADRGATPQERERAYELARGEFDGLVVLPDRTRRSPPSTGLSIWACACSIPHRCTGSGNGNDVSVWRSGSCRAIRSRLRPKIGRILHGATEPTFEYSPAAIRRSLAGSLERLGVDRVDVVPVHDPDLRVDEVLRSTLPALRTMQSDGLIGAVGAGMNYSAPLTRFVESGLVDCVLIAGRWTLLDQSASEDLLPAALANGVSVIAAGVFNSGVLADPDGPLGQYFYGPTPPDVLARVRRIQEICRHYDVSLQSAALQFPMRHPAVTTVCVGCRSATEVECNDADLTSIFRSSCGLTWRGTVSSRPMFERPAMPQQGRLQRRILYSRVLTARHRG